MPQDTLPLHVRVRIEGRDARLAELGFSSYRDYLSSPRWFDKRQAYRESDLPQECMCGADEVDLHHMTYERVGEEELTDLTPLCSNCHQMVHALERRGVITLDFQGLEDPMRAYLYRVERMEAVERAADEAPAELVDRVKARQAERWRNKRAKKVPLKHSPLPTSSTMTLGDQLDALMEVARQMGFRDEAEAEANQIRRRMAVFKNVLNQHAKARRRAA